MTSIQSSESASSLRMSLLVASPPPVEGEDGEGMEERESSGSPDKGENGGERFDGVEDGEEVRGDEVRSEGGEG